MENEVLSVLTQFRSEMLGRFERNDGRFGSVETGLQALQNGLMQFRAETLERFESAETRTEALQNGLMQFRDQTLERLESAETGMQNLRNDMNSHFDEVYHRLNMLKAEYYIVDAVIRQLQERVAAGESKFATRTEFVEVSERVEKLSQRIDELEAEL